MKNAILKNKNINKLSKNEYDVYKNTEIMINYNYLYHLI